MTKKMSKLSIEEIKILAFFLRYRTFDPSKDGSLIFMSFSKISQLL